MNSTEHMLSSASATMLFSEGSNPRQLSECPLYMWEIRQEKQLLLFAWLVSAREVMRRLEMFIVRDTLTLTLYPPSTSQRHTYTDFVSSFYKSEIH